MVKTRVLINTIEKVKNFSSICSKQSFDIDLVSGRYVVDAKSIMGIFSLSLMNVMDLVIYASNEEAKGFIETIDTDYIKPAYKRDLSDTDN